jgi:hypothetical protein
VLVRRCTAVHRVRAHALRRDDDEALGWCLPGEKCYTLDVGEERPVACLRDEGPLI